MNELLAKLMNLSYEFFGIFLPGIIATFFLLLYWISLGEAAPAWTFNTIPEFNAHSLSSLIDTITMASGISAAFPLIIIWYFFGHIIHWIGRSGDSMDEKDNSAINRISHSLLFKIPKPKNSYNLKLQPLFDVVKKDFSSEQELDWGQFFPVAKIYLMQHTNTSLVSNYQNKYTLHRSITTASSILVWLVLTAILGTIISYICNFKQANCGELLGLLILAIIFVWGFSASYMYHWEMFGNTIVTETYSLLHGPKDANVSKK